MLTFVLKFAAGAYIAALVRLLLRFVALHMLHARDIACFAHQYDSYEEFTRLARLGWLKIALHIYMYIYIYRERERDREREILNDLCISQNTLKLKLG